MKGLEILSIPPAVDARCMLQRVWPLSRHQTRKRLQHAACFRVGLRRATICLVRPKDMDPT